MRTEHDAVPNRFVAFEPQGGMLALLLAAVGYELLVGHPPHDLRNRPVAAALSTLLTRSVPSPRTIDPTIPRDVAAVFEKARSI